MDCVFCKIVSGEYSSYKLWEDDNYLAILDLFPAVDGQTLVISKKHLDSNIFNLESEDFLNINLAAQKVAKLLVKLLGVVRCAEVIEGLGVNHAHIKLFPLTESKLAEGGLVALGEKASDEKLSELQNLIISPPSPADAGFGEVKGGIISKCLQ